MKRKTCSRCSLQELSLLKDSPSSPYLYFRLIVFKEQVHMIFFSNLPQPFYTKILILDLTAMVILHGTVLPIVNYPGLGVPKKNSLSP